MKIKTDKLIINAENIRKNYENLEELGASIKQNGLIQPIVVTENEHHGLYTVIAGNRRTQAAILVGVEELEAKVIPADDKDAIAIALQENTLRENLTKKEQADAYKQLSLLGLTAADIAKQTGISQKKIKQNIKAADVVPETLWDNPQASLDQLVEIAELEEKDLALGKRLANAVGKNYDFTKAQIAREIELKKFLADFADNTDMKPYDVNVMSFRDYVQVGGQTSDGKYYKFENYQKAPVEYIDGEYWKECWDGVAFYVKREVQEMSEPIIASINTKEQDEYNAKWQAHIDSLKAYILKLTSAKETLAEKTLAYLADNAGVNISKKNWIGEYLIRFISNAEDNKSLIELADYKLSDEEKKLYE